MAIRIEHVGGVTFVYIEGTFKDGPETDALRSTLQVLVAERRKIFVNLAKTDLLTSYVPV